MTSDERIKKLEDAFRKLIEELRNELDDTQREKIISLLK